MKNQIDQLAVNTIRLLAVDAVEKAKSGHPGMPMGAADFAYVLWTKFLRHNPEVPKWPCRDRFVLSAGHGSMLLYAMLHLSGYDISLEDIKNFRQWGSPTPGHPERDLDRGIETTTGPLGQGFGMAVGMAIAEKMLAARFNTEEIPLVKHRIFGIAGDGDLMEGVSSEAASLAGHLGLGNIVFFYDDNRITIEGPTSLTYSEDVEMRFNAYNWHVVSVDGHDRDAITEAIEAGIDEFEKPTLIIGRTHIAFGSPGKQDSSSSHGAPLGPEEVAATKKNLDWDAETDFYVPPEVQRVFDDRRGILNADFEAWQEEFKEFLADPQKAAQWDCSMKCDIPEGLLPKFLAVVPTEPKATRAVSGAVLQVAASEVPFLIGGSADLGPSNNTWLKESGVIATGDFTGRNFHFGVREHAMGAIMNGMALHGGFIPYGGTFLVFSDYMRPAIRLAALMKQHVIYVFTHDSFYLGEDGPTHQPIEHVASLRAMHNLVVIRPADGAETAAAWTRALENCDGPTALVLTRQGLPPLPGDRTANAESAMKGGYIVVDSGGGKPEVILIATGSEVSLALEVKAELDSEGTKTRVVSLPSWEVFEEQPAQYKESVLPRECLKRVTIEAGAPFGWERYAGPEGLMVSMTSFGASAPAKVLAEKFGFTKESVLKRIKKWK